MAKLLYYRYNFLRPLNVCTKWYTKFGVALTDPAGARKFVIAQGLQKFVDLRRKIGALKDDDHVLTLRSHGITKSKHDKKIKGFEFFYNQSRDVFVIRYAIHCTKASNK